VEAEEPTKIRTSPGRQTSSSSENRSELFPRCNSPVLGTRSVQNLRLGHYAIAIHIQSSRQLPAAITS
jgi:hypothetical protein